jgi:DNA/RNA endonuclease YhcR with UshA esterase domain
VKTIRIILGLCLLMVLAGGISLVAQSKTPASRETYPYDNSNQVIVIGVVEDVKDYQCPVTGTVGTHITVRRATGTIEVHLAPATFMKHYEIVVNKGDNIEIQGSKILFEGKPALLAKAVAIDRTTYAFRDAAGKPLW